MKVDRDESMGAGAHATPRLTFTRADVVALLVLLLALCWAYRSMIGVDWRDHAPILFTAAESGAAVGGFAAEVDQRFVIWLIARGARTWSEAPSRLFQGETCHPTPRSLTLGEPAFTLSLLGAPLWLVSGDPIVTYDGVVVLSTLLSALAMYWLVRDWTRSPPAALSAALLYAFHPLKVSDPVHLYIPDMTWLLLALSFFQRWLERGRWRDVVGLGLAAAGQIGGSLYPLIASAAIGSCFAGFAVFRLGVRRTRVLQWLALAGWVGVTLALVFGPYLAQMEAGGLREMPLQVHLPWRMVFGFEAPAYGWGLLLLAATAAFPRREGATGFDPRPALGLGLVFTLLLATGGNQVEQVEAIGRGEAPPVALPNLFAALASVLPGLSAVRAPAAIGHGGYLVLAALAGLGLAELLRRVPDELRRVVSSASVALAFVIALRPFLPDAPALGSWPMRPPEQALALHEALLASGNDGPILELPGAPRPHPRYGLSILLSAYHHRPTSACHNSFIPAETREAEAVARAIPDEDAVRRARAMGFTTVVLFHDVPRFDTGPLRARLQAASRGRDASLRLLRRNAFMSAYEIGPGDGD